MIEHHALSSVLADHHILALAGGVVALPDAEPSEAAE
jgi:hypothetical protein